MKSETDDKYNKQLSKFLSILPNVNKVKVRGEADYYGVANLVAKKIGIPFTPRSFSGWKHGWLIANLDYKEQLTSGSDYDNFLVPLLEHKYFLDDIGINSHAVGMPFIYMDDIVLEKINRIPNSLLIMPPHSLPYTEHNWDEENYVKQINEIKGQFDFVVVCLHQSCIEKRLWIDTFKKYNIQYIIGADALDKNALIRMYKIFSSFEFMTTNSIGSHIVYAAYCGCKVSIFGKYLEFSKIDFINDPLYKKFPNLLEHNLKFLSEKFVKKSFPDLFTTPSNAKVMKKWADEQLGKNNQVSFYRLATLLGWLPHTQLILYSKIFFRKILKHLNFYNTNKKVKS